MLSVVCKTLTRNRCLNDFIDEYAKFPFPHPVEDGTVGITDISNFEVGLLKREWKAVRAVRRDDNLVQKLCQTLKYILGDTPLVADAEDSLLTSFAPRLQFTHGIEDLQWRTNPSEAKVGF